MLRKIDIDEFYLLDDDPVRPHILKQDKLCGSRDVMVWCEDFKVQACVCLSYTEDVVEDEKGLYRYGDSVVMLYSIWSYNKGAGRKLVQSLLEEYKDKGKRIVTLSPKTEMARNFHLSNGAIELKENEDTINYEYVL